MVNLPDPSLSLVVSKNSSVKRIPLPIFIILNWISGPEYRSGASEPEGFSQPSTPIFSNNYTLLQKKRWRWPPPPPPPTDNFWRPNLPRQTIYHWKGNLSNSPIHFRYRQNILISQVYEQFSRNDSAISPEKISNFKNINIQGVPKNLLESGEQYVVVSRFSSVFAECLTRGVINAARIFILKFYH